MKGSKITVLLSYLSIASISANIITPALPHIESYYHLTKGDLGWVVSIFMVGYVVGQLLYGPLANRFGRLFALRIGLSINLIGIFFCLISFIPISYPLLLIGRLTTGFGSAFLVIAIMLTAVTKSLSNNSEASSRSNILD